MCGITGFLQLAATGSAEVKIATVRRMANTLCHRGPDDRGEWVDARAGVALGHTRLSIIDPSSHGHQPMSSRDGRYKLVYNGEIYNHRQLRGELENLGHTFAGHCDTEILLSAFTQWGLVETVKRSNGMFALAVWDRHEEHLTLIRDRLGIKPLYYGWQNGTFLFGSELKSLRVHDDFRGEICRDALGLYMRYNYVPCPYSIYQNIYKLPPGCVLTMRPAATERCQPSRYWDPGQAARDAAHDRLNLSECECVDLLEKTLRDAIDIRMYADVDLGAFLSGGIDSSTIVALMQAQSSRPVKTYSIGFEESSYNEARDAKAVARHLGTDHTEWYVSASESREVIPHLPEIYDEPFGDSSQIPTYLVSRLAQRDVKVSLSGDGGDELFGGYRRYGTTIRRWNWISSLPAGVRTGASRLLRATAPTPWFARKANSLAGQLGVNSPADIYDYSISHWRRPQELVVGCNSVKTIHSNYAQWQVSDELLDQMMFVDQVTYLPDDILVKVDRASMATSLEARVPLLDHRVVELAWSLPTEMKHRHCQTKWLLRELLSRFVPRVLFERPKQGFGIPIDSWLRGPLRDWAESLLSPDRLQQEGFFNPEPIRQKWQEHQQGTVDWHYHLWDVLMFQSWLEVQERRPSIRTES